MREPRSFLYDDYMDDEVAERPSYGRSDLHGRSEFGMGSSGLRGGNSRSRGGVDFDLDDYSSIRRPAEGLRRREDPLGDFGSPIGTNPQSRRFANAMGIPPSRSQRTYDDLDYAPVPRGRLQQIVYRDAPARARQVVRRVVGGGGRDYLDDSRGEVVEIVERVRRPQRRIQVVRKVPIHQRVVKKVIVKQSSRPGNRRSNSFGNTNLGGRVNRTNQQQQGRRNVSGGVQKKKFAGRGGPKREAKPKLSATELDRELDEYMKGSKHPRVEL